MYKLKYGKCNRWNKATPVEIRFAGNYEKNIFYEQKALHNSKCPALLLPPFSHLSSQSSLSLFRSSVHLENWRDIFFDEYAILPFKEPTGKRG